MESFFSRFKNPMVLIAILLVETLALAVQVHRPLDPASPDGAQVRLLRLWTLRLFSPVERLATGTGHGVRNAWTSYIDLRGVRQQNKGLQQEVAELRLQRAALAEDALEGQRLERLEKFQQQYVASTVAAEVIGTSGSEQSRVLILNKGANEGLKPDMAVITPDGIVGKLRDVFPRSSQLLLIDDQTSGAGVTLESTRIRAIVQGTTDGRVVIGNLTEDSRIKPGERVLTSGGDQVFPRGLPVGQVVSIAPDPEHQPYTRIILRPAANLNQLDEVLVITGTAPSLKPEVTAAVSADAAAAEAADNGAAERSARLPGIHADKPEAPEPGTPGADAADAKPPADNAPGLVPKPQPAVHPDRYSPGTAPPAVELTPGAPH